MRLLSAAAAESRRGRRLRQRLARRAAGLLDERLLGRARRLVDGVRRGGDRALVAAVSRLDGVAVADAAALRLEPGARAAELPAGFREAFERALTAIERYHAAQRHDGFRLDGGGVELVERRMPLRRVGVYVPGGRAAYPSTVMMTVVPARLAGVEQIAVATPPGGFAERPALRWALERLGVDEVWGMGGAHAVAALAYGTPTIERVDKIVGPGNAWVTAAKRLVQGDVAIDGLAGPSELVVVATADADPALVAADLLAQAEHDPLAQVVLITPDKKLPRRVERELRRGLEALATAEVARAALAHHGIALVVDDIAAAAPLVDEIAPEHLQLVGDGAEALAERIQNAAAIFVGAATPEVFGDYLAGPSHVLPTCGTARFASALGVEDFVRRSHLIRYTPTAAARAASAAAVLADAEGLPAHAAAARRRLEMG